MAIIQMWPENQGLRNSITFDGRTYSSIPGVSTPVPDSDVAVLQANGWTTFSMTGGKTTITMLSPAKAVYSQITINGHTYSALACRSRPRYSTPLPCKQTAGLWCSSPVSRFNRLL